MQFTFASNDINEIGTHTVTFKGEVTGYTSVYATNTFTLTVADPCLGTILNPPVAGISAMTTSVLVQTTPDGAPLQVTQ